MLRVDGLHIRYGAVRAVGDVSFEVRAATAVALIGANGAGKSSVLRGILGLAQSSGSIKLDGRPLDALPTHARVSSGVALSPEGRHVFAQMSVLDNLDAGAGRAPAVERSRRAEEMFELFPRLAERRGQLAGSMSGGEQQMLAIARALMSRPRLLMLDEPTLGLAPIVVGQLVEILGRLKRQGLAILLAEQNAEMALEASDFAYVLETGALKRSGSSVSLVSDPAIQADYLGI